MKRFLVGLMVAAVAVLGFGVSAAAAPAGTLQSFGTGTVTINPGGSVTIVNLSGQFGGVYNKSKTQSGMLLSAVTFSFVSTGFETGGAPRFSIPINTDGTGGSVAGYAFIDAPGCGGTPGSTTTVSTGSPTCGVNFQSVEYPNWAAFASANSTYTVAQGHFPFVIADEPGNYAVNSIFLG